MKAPWQMSLREFSRRRSGGTARLYQQMLKRVQRGAKIDYDHPLAAAWRRADQREESFWTRQVRPLLAHWIRAEEPGASDSTLDYAMSGHYSKTDLELHQTIIFAALRLGLNVPAQVLRERPEVIEELRKTGGPLP